MSLVLLSALGSIAAVMVWRGSVALEDSIDRLSRHYRIPALVQGSLLAAVGSSLPELSSSVLSTSLHGELELGVAIVVGSAVFNILVIPALSALRDGLRVSRDLIYRDAQFYVISIAVLLLAFSLAVIYRPAEGAALRGEMGRLIALLPLALYGLYLFVQFLDTVDDRAPDEQTETGPREDDGESGAVRRQWLRLLLGVVLILFGSEGLVRTAIGLGETFGTPSFLWGVTVVAAATSAPDAMVSFRAARSGRGVVSLGNVLGSNIFDLLVAIPAGIMVAGSTVVDFGVTAPLMGALTIATVLLFALLRTGMMLSRLESFALLGSYALFLAWMVLETVGVTSALGR